MAKSLKKPKYRFFIHKEGKEVELNDLTEEERQRVGIWAYQTLVRGLGYAPVNEKINYEEGRY